MLGTSPCDVSTGSEALIQATKKLPPQQTEEVSRAASVSLQVSCKQALRCPLLHARGACCLPRVFLPPAFYVCFWLAFSSAPCRRMFAFDCRLAAFLPQSAVRSILI